MKRNNRQSFRPWIIGAALLAVGFMPKVALADSSIHTVLNGRPITFPDQPVIEQSRTLVPARDLLEALGATVNWDQSTKTVTATLGDKTVKAIIGKWWATVNGKLYNLDAPVHIINDRTYIPVRFFAESLGLSVGWNNTTRTVEISTQGSQLSTTSTTDPNRAQVASRDGSAVINRKGDTAVALAKQALGKPYVWGGTSLATGFDCSGLINWIARQLGVDVPRTSYELFNVGVKISQDSLQAGDLVFFNTEGDGAGHVGIYDGNGGFIHAEAPGVGVVDTPLDKAWWVPRYLGARRIFR